MATVQTQPETQPATEAPETKKPEAALLDQVIERTSFDDPLANLLDPHQFAQIQRVAKLFAMSSLVPTHLLAKSMEGTIANMVLVINQALRWKLDPFQVAAESYVVGGKLAFQGKLVAGVINSRCGLSKRLSYDFRGSGKDRTITVSGTMKGEHEPRVIDLRLGDAETQNAMWKKDPDQKLVYSGVVKWARRHAPEVMLGIMTDDDLERMQEDTAAPAPPRYDDQERPATGGSRAGALARHLSGGQDLEADREPEPEPAREEKPAKSKAKPKAKPEPEAEPEIPKVSDHLKPAREALLKCGTADEIAAVINQWAKEPDEFDELSAVGEWMRATGKLGKPKQGSLVD